MFEFLRLDTCDGCWCVNPSHSNGISMGNCGDLDFTDFGSVEIFGYIHSEPCIKLILVEDLYCSVFSA